MNDTASPTEQPDFPPDVPEIERRVRIGPRQLVGLLLLALVPLLALAGLLEHHQSHEVRTSPALEVEVEFPARIRGTREAIIRISAANRTDATLQQVRVTLPDRYLAAFDRRQGSLEPVPADFARLGPIPPGETRMVTLYLVAVRSGLHRGEVRVEAADGDAIVVPVRTFILP